MKALDEDCLRVIAEGQAADHPETGAADRVWERVSAELDAPLSPVAEAASRSLSGAGPAAVAGVGMKLGIGALSLAALGVTGYLLLQTRAEPESRAADRARSGQGATSGVAAPAPGPAGLPTGSELPSALEPAAPGTDGLAEEARLLGTAQRALSRGQPAKAERFLAVHRERFPAGALAQERDAAWVLTLCELGQRREAELARRAFKKAWPGSALSSRVQQTCR